MQHGIFDYLQKGAIDVGAPGPGRARRRRPLAPAAREPRAVERLRESNRLLTALHDISAASAGERHLDRLLAGSCPPPGSCATPRRAGAALRRRREASASWSSGARRRRPTLPGVRLLPGEGIATRAFERERGELVAGPRRRPAVLERARRAADRAARPPLRAAAPRPRARRAAWWPAAGRRFGAADRDVLASPGASGRGRDRQRARARAARQLLHPHLGHAGVFLEQHRRLSIPATRAAVAAPRGHGDAAAGPHRHRAPQHPLRRPAPRHRQAAGPGRAAAAPRTTRPTQDREIAAAHPALGRRAC